LLLVSLLILVKDLYRTWQLRNSIKPNNIGSKVAPTKGDEMLQIEEPKDLKAKLPPS